MQARHDLLKIRPETFRLNYASPLARGLVFAGLGLIGSQKPTVYHDSSLYGYHGLLTNMDPPTDWVWNDYLGRWVLDFDGSNDCITGLTKIALPALWTHLAWVYLTTYPTATYAAAGICATFCESPGHLTQDRGLGVETEAQGGHVNAYAYDTAPKYAPGPAVPLNQWNLLAASYDGTNLISYCNGVAGTPVATGANYTGYTSPELSWGVIRTTYLVGRMADMLSYSRALSASEISALADPSNAMLSGLIQAPRRRVYRGAAAGGGTNYTRTIDDSMGLSDACSRVVDFGRALSEALGLTDARLSAAEFGRSVADALGLLDAATAAAAFDRSVADALGLTDAASRAAQFSRAVADPVGLVDDLTRVAGFLRSVDDAEGLTDSIARVAAFIRALADAEGLSDNVTKVFSGDEASAALLFLLLRAARQN